MSLVSYPTGFMYINENKVYNFRIRFAWWQTHSLKTATKRGVCECQQLPV